MTKRVLSMNRVLCMGLLITVFNTPKAVAQTVFFDDFDGNALAPHWNQPPANWWEYNVSNSMLNVTGLFNPSSPHSPVNHAQLRAFNAFSVVGDFQLNVRMGWGSIDVWRFDVSLLVDSGVVATAGYREIDTNGPPGIFGWTNGGMATIPAPGPGIYDFQIARTGTQISFYFEQSLIGTLNDPYGGPVNGLFFHFSGPYPGYQGPFYVDSVRMQAIPAPGCAVVFILISFMSNRKRQR